MFEPTHFYLIISDRPLSLEGAAYFNHLEKDALTVLCEIAGQLGAHFTTSSLDPDCLFCWETWHATLEEAAMVRDYVDAVQKAISMLELEG